MFQDFYEKVAGSHEQKQRSFGEETRRNYLIVD
jgi:hypothetical protein